MNENQTRVLTFLKDLEYRLKNEQIKGINQILKEHDLPPSIGTVAKDMNIFYKGEDGFLVYGEMEPSNELAVELEQNNRFYHQTQKQYPIVEAFMNEDPRKSPFAIPFNEVWQFVGYNQKSDAIYIVNQYLNESTDYVVLRNNPENPNGFTGVSAKGGRPEKIIYMNNYGLLKFVQHAGTYRARLFRNKIVESLRKTEETYLKHVSKIEIQQTTSKKSEDIQEAIQMLRKALDAETTGIHERNIMGTQLTFDFNDDAYWEAKQFLAQNVYDLILKGCPHKYLNSDEKNTESLSEGILQKLLA